MLLLRVLLLFIYSVHYRFHFVPIFRSFLLSPRLQSSSLRQIWKGEQQGVCEAALEGRTTSRLEVLCPLKFSNFGFHLLTECCIINKQETRNNTVLALHMRHRPTLSLNIGIDLWKTHMSWPLIMKRLLQTMQAMSNSFTKQLKQEIQIQ